ncbi:hypothetical protein MM239_04895 [Belliella sp. DSM 111904]|uniref:Uncharacterized protein n=1 Tax=Belliella filtrata TaxID=2923435 RepID=A0ABS9UX17_9BACT|nr:hypothetical protein [Belliella filtrata]MCH7408721.1 hypothetical protein [Belliella filtrata]
MKKALLFLMTFLVVLVGSAQQSTKVQDVSCSYVSQFTGKVDGQSDSVFVQTLEIDFRQEVAITGVSFDDKDYQNELLSSNRTGEANNGGGKSRKMFIGESSPYFEQIKKSKDMYLMDTEKRIYRVRLDSPVPIQTKEEYLDQDPKMVIRKPKSNDNLPKQ